MLEIRVLADVLAGRPTGGRIADFLGDIEIAEQAFVSANERKSSSLIGSSEEKKRRNSNGFTGETRAHFCDMKAKTCSTEEDKNEQNSAYVSDLSVKISTKLS